MNTHPTLEQLVLLQDPDCEPGAAGVRAHVAHCEECQQEVRRLDQRVARLRALPTLRPGRDGWPRVRSRHVASRRARQARWLGAGSVGLAATVLFVLAVPSSVSPAVDNRATESAIREAREQSSVLEATIRNYNPAARVIDGHTARVALSIEDRIATLDEQLLRQASMPSGPEAPETLDLWRERVGLLDALVDVHLTSGGNVGM